MKRGFTLIEMLIAIGLLGALLTGIIVIINPQTQINKTQDAKRKSDLAQLQRALDLYYNDIGRYPPVTSGYVINNMAWGSAWSTYMNALPKDPDPGKTYVYYASGDGQSYWLYANLAYASDPQACPLGRDCPHVPGANLCGGKPCNYGISSSNVTP